MTSYTKDEEEEDAYKATTYEEEDYKLRLLQTALE